ncbi:MAG: TolC family outer membrane protein [Porticoccaceae bacterium]|nr:TolC family outer membrane protein [Porticoccaceae bacterium]
MLKVKQGFLTLCSVLLISQGSSADSLKDIYELALQSDPTLRAARANFQVGQETKNISRAYLLPVITATGSYQETEGDSESARIYFGGEPALSNQFSDSKETAYGVSLRQPLFDMPAWYQFQRGKALSESAAAQFAADQQTLILRVSSAYLGALRAYDNNETRKAEQRAIQRQLEQTRERFEVGLLPVTDVHEAQAVFDDALVNSLEARGAVNIAFDALQVLTGKNHNVLSGLKDDFMATNPEPLSSEEWVNFSLSSNYQLKTAKLGKDATYNLAKAATAELFPTITFNANYSNRDSDGTTIAYLPTGNAMANTFSNSDGHSFSVNLSMPLWSSGINAGRRQYKQQAIASSENFEVAKRNTVQTARSRHQLVITNAARVKARKQAITSADSALGATQAGYEVGTRNIVDVLAAQRSVFQAKRNYANARYDYIFAMMSLKEVAGQLSPDDIYQLNAWLDPSLAVAK